MRYLFSLLLLCSLAGFIAAQDIGSVGTGMSLTGGGQVFGGLGGSQVLLGSSTISADTTSVSLSLDSSFDFWEVRVMGITVDADAEGLYLQISSASTTQTANYSYHYHYIRDGSSGRANANSTSASEIVILRGAASYGIDVTDGLGGCTVRIFGPNSTTVHKPIYYHCVSEGSTDNATKYEGVGLWSGGTGALDGITISTSSGTNNMTAGKIAVIGYTL